MTDIHTRLCLVCCGVVTLVGGGCSSDSPVAPATLVFGSTQQSSKNVVAGEAVTASFPFSVVGERPVTITHVSKSCGCLVVDDEVLERPLLPGSQHRLTLSMSTADRVGEVVGTVMLITDPPSPEPIEVMVRALVQSSPRLVQRGAVRVRTSLSTTSPFQVSVEAIRPLDQQPFRWDEERSELSGMHVEDYQTTETLRDSASKVQAASIRELHTWTLTPPGELPLGEHSFNLLMDWSDRSTVEIPVVVIVEHPLRLSLDRVYFGELSPSERKVVRVYVRGAAREEASNVDAQVDLSFVTARYEDSEAAVRLEVSAPGECGPFAGHLSVSLAGKPVPVAVIPISGTVRPPDERSSN